ncbi:hypothetical protein P7C70_g4465, partial [Phenoliferia sp. Uapishka_3]
MPPRALVTEGVSNNPAAIVVHWCRCTQCTTSNHLGGWRRPKVWLDHQSLRLVADLGKFDGPLRVGFRLPASAELGGSLDTAEDVRRKRSRSRSENVDADEAARHHRTSGVEGVGVASGSQSLQRQSSTNTFNAGGREDAELPDFEREPSGEVATPGSGAPTHAFEDSDNMGGHDEFQFPDNMDQDSQDVVVGEPLAVDAERGRHRARTPVHTDDDHTDDDTSEESDVYADEEDQVDPLLWKPIRGQPQLPGFGALILGEDEEADAAHQRPDSRAGSDADLYDETDAEYLARILAQRDEEDPFAVPAPIDLRNLNNDMDDEDFEDFPADADLPFQHQPGELEPEGDKEDEVWPDLPYDQSDDDGRADGGSPGAEETPEAAEARRRAQDDDHDSEGSQAGDPVFGNPAHDEDDEFEGEDGEEPEADEDEAGPALPARKIASAPKAERAVPKPNVPCEPRSRDLSRDDLVRVLFYEMAVDYAMGAQLIQRIRWFLQQIGVDVEGIESLHMLRQHAFELSELKIRYSDQCAGHVTSADPATADWSICKHVPNPKKFPDIICGATRYFPINTPNLATLRKNSQKLGQVAPPMHKVPRDQHSHCEIGSFVDAMYANPTQSADILRANQESIAAAISDSSRIDSFQTAEMPRKFFDPDEGVCNPNDLLLSTTSDGADIYPLSTPNSAVNAHLAGVRIPGLKSMQHKFLYVAAVNGPVKAQTGLYMHDIAADLLVLEEPKDRYVGALAAIAETRVFGPLNTSDTVEQCVLSGTVGATGKCPSMTHSVRGVWNLGLGRWQHPLLSFRCAPADEDEWDDRPDVWTVFNPLPIPGRLGKTFRSNVRRIEHYDKVVNQLLDPNLTEAQKMKIQLDSGIKGRSSYDRLGIFRWAYPWMFSLDDMHVTYSNNMKHFLEAIFGKVADKPTLRGVMINSESHKAMIDALGRTIHLQPAAHGQKVRSIEHIGHLKAAELRSFMWFHLASLMHGVYERPKDMALVVAAIRSTRLTTHRVIDMDAPFDPDFCTYAYNDAGEFPVPFANLRHAQDDFLIKRERLFVGRKYEFGATCVASLIRSHALPDMARKWGAGLLATTQWGLEGKIGDIKRNIKSRTLPVKNMENNNIDMNIITLIHLRYDVEQWKAPVKMNLRENHPTLPDTTFLHSKKEKATLSPHEGRALYELLRRNGLVGGVGSKQPTRWQRVRLANGEIIGSMGREYGTELGRIITEEGVEDDFREREREGIRRATRFAKITKRAKTGVVNNERDHRIFEVESFLSVPLAPDNRPFFVAFGHTFLPAEDMYNIQEAVSIGAKDRTFGAIGIEEIRHGVGLTLGIQRPEEPEEKFWVTMSDTVHLDGIPPSRVRPEDHEDLFALAQVWVDLVHRWRDSSPGQIREAGRRFSRIADQLATRSQYAPSDTQESREVYVQEWLYCKRSDPGAPPAGGAQPSLPVALPTRPLPSTVPIGSSRRTPAPHRLPSETPAPVASASTLTGWADLFRISGVVDTEADVAAEEFRLTILATLPDFDASIIKADPSRSSTTVVPIPSGRFYCSA